MSDSPESLETLIGLLLAVYREPLRYQEQLKGPLPEPFHPVLRLAVGKSPPGTASFCRRWKTSSEDLRKAAIFFIEQACLGEKQDPYRMLGLNSGVAPHAIQAHYHLLMQLFHPDRSESTASWRDAYAARINEAYQRLRKPAQRQAYEREPVSVELRRKAPSLAYNYRPLQKKSSLLVYLVQRFPKTIRYLPQLILGGGIAVTAGLLVSLYFAEIGPETISALSPGKEEVTFKRPPASRRVALEQEKVLPWVARSPVLSLAEIPGQAPEKPAEATATGQARILKTAAIPAKPITAQSSLGVPEAPAQKEYKPEGQTPLVEPSSAFSQAQHPSGSAGVNSARGVPSATPGELPSGKKKPDLARVSEQAPTLPAPPLQQEALQTLLQRFIRAYQQGDLEGFLSFFSPDARTNEYSGWSAIHQDYARFFAATQARKLQLVDLQWVIEGNIAHGKGYYIARIRKPEGTYESWGRIHFQVRRHKGTTRITRLFNTVNTQQLGLPHD